MHHRVRRVFVASVLLAAVASSLPAAADEGRAGLLQAIARHAAVHGVPVALAQAIVRGESRFDPRARSGPNWGLTQIHLATARSMGFRGPPEGLFDPETNLGLGIRYLAQAHRAARGDLCRTVMKYQNGLRSETMSARNQAYCAKIRGFVASFRG